MFKSPPDAIPDALHELRDALADLVSWATFAGDGEIFRKATPEAEADLTETALQLERRGGRVEAARAALVAAGFPVPRAWLAPDAAVRTVGPKWRPAVGSGHPQYVLSWEVPPDPPALRDVLAAVDEERRVRGIEADAGDRAASAGGEAAGDAPTPALDPDTPVAVSTLAKMYGVNQESLRKRLERQRGKDFECFTEVQEQKPREPRFLYKPRLVHHIIEDMRAKASGEASAERPARKKPPDFPAILAR